MTNNQSPTQKEVICTCTGTTKEQIKELIENGMDTAETIAYQTGAGTGCGACDYLISDLIRENKTCQDLKT
jgi:bacterioferritin-associated ferredoxin